MNEVFSGAYLDIDMARTVNGSTAAATAIFWNEPARNAIGMFQNPVLPDIEPGTQIGEESEEQNATEFNLSQNYPNPFNPTTTFEFTLPKDASVTLTVYNTLGQLVAIVLDNKIMNEGKQSTMFDGRNLPTGVYYYHLRAVEVPKAGATAGVGNVLMDVKKMILMK